MTPISANTVSASPASAGTGLARSTTAGQATFEPDEDEELGPDEEEEPEDDADEDEPLPAFLSLPLSPLPSEDDPESGLELEPPSPDFPFDEATAGSAPFWPLRLSVR
jgi:hypothetical protein